VLHHQNVGGRGGGGGNTRPNKTIFLRFENRNYTWLLRNQPLEKHDYYICGWKNHLRRTIGYWGANSKIIAQYWWKHGSYALIDWPVLGGYQLLNTPNQIFKLIKTHTRHDHGIKVQGLFLIGMWQIYIFDIYIYTYIITKGVLIRQMISLDFEWSSERGLVNYTHIL
jgi:hypothetical protein